jgi:hypothetical protein
MTNKAGMSLKINRYDRYVPIADSSRGWGPRATGPVLGGLTSLYRACEHNEAGMSFRINTYESGELPIADSTRVPVARER